MSRPPSYNTQDIRYDDDQALPLFNTTHHPSIPQIQTELIPSSHRGRYPPPSAHQSRHSISHSNQLSSPFGPTQSPGISLNSPNRHQRQGSMSSALPYTRQSHLYDQESMMPPPSASSSLGNLARSASLGRRKDPYAYSSDDVESGMGSMAFESSLPFGTIQLPQPNIPPPMSSQNHQAHSSRDIVMSPARNSAYSNTGHAMNPPPVPAHPPQQKLTRPSAAQYHSDGSSPSIPSYSSQGPHNSFNNPYVPRGSDPGPSANQTGLSNTPNSQQSAQWTDYRRPSSNRMPSTGSYSAHSPVSEHPMSSPYLRPDMMGSSPHSPLANPYDLSPNQPSINLPPSPRHPAWPSLDNNIPQSPPYARSMSNQSYPASQPVTPAKGYEGGPPRVSAQGTMSDLRREHSASAVGFREVRDRNDLRPSGSAKNVGRRADPDQPGKFLSVSRRPLGVLIAASEMLDHCTTSDLLSLQPPIPI